MISRRMLMDSEIIDKSGTQIFLEDRKTSYFSKFNIYGKSEQIKFDGIQLFNPNDLVAIDATFNVLDNGKKIIVEGQKAYARVEAKISEDILNTIRNKRVYLYGKRSGAQIPKTIKIKISKDNGEDEYFDTNTIGDIIIPRNATELWLQLVMNDSAQDLPNIEASIFENVGLSTKVKIQTSWEPYTGGKPSPNPDFPQNIKILSSDTTNLWTGENITGAIIGSSSGYFVAPDNFKNFILNLPNNEYSYSAKISEGTSAGVNCGKIAFQKKDTNFIIEPTNTFILTDEVKSNTEKIIIYGNMGNDISYTEIMINIGKPKPYEPSIKNINVRLNGTNLFKAYKNDTINGITFTSNENDGTLRIQGTNNSSSAVKQVYNFKEEDFLKNLSNGRYIISGIPKDINKKCYIEIENSKGGGISYGTMKGTVKDTGNGGVFDFEFFSEEKQSISFCVAANVTLDITIKPMITMYLDQNKIPYEVYKEPKILNLNISNGLHGIKTNGNDYTYIDNNKTKYIANTIEFYSDKKAREVQRLSYLVLDGSTDEPWIINSTNDESKKRLLYSKNNLFKSHEINSMSPGLCNLFSFVSSDENGTYGCHEGISINNNGILSVYCDKFNTEDSVSAWREFLKSNNLIVVAPLATPIYTDLSSEEIDNYKKIHTDKEYKMLQNNMNANMTVSYRKYRNR